MPAEILGIDQTHRMLPRIQDYQLIDGMTFQ